MVYLSSPSHMKQKRSPKNVLYFTFDTNKKCVNQIPVEISSFQKKMVRQQNIKIHCMVFSFCRFKKKLLSQESKFHKGQEKERILHELSKKLCSYFVIQKKSLHVLRKKSQIRQKVFHSEGLKKKLLEEKRKLPTVVKTTLFFISSFHKKRSQKTIKIHQKAFTLLIKEKLKKIKVKTTRAGETTLSFFLIYYYFSVFYFESEKFLTTHH